MNAYADMVIRDVLVGEYGLTREMAEEMVWRNNRQKMREAKELQSILECWTRPGMGTFLR